MSEIFITFVIASSLICLAPGPDNLFVLTQSALYGRNSGIVVTLGLCTGLIVHTLAVALGVAVIFQTSELAFNALKYLGAAYLIYLAILSFRAQPTDISDSSNTALSPKALYLRGIIMNITNPKVSIFFLAFLPQFVDAANGNMTFQFMTLGLTFIIIALLIFSCIASLAGLLGDWLTKKHRNQVILNRVAGAVFAGLAIKLITSNVSG